MPYFGNSSSVLANCDSRRYSIQPSIFFISVGHINNISLKCRSGLHLLVPFYHHFRDILSEQIKSGKEQAVKVSKGSPMSYSLHFSQISPFQCQNLQSPWIIGTVKSCLDSLIISVFQVNTSMLGLSFHQTREISQEAC